MLRKKLILINSCVIVLSVLVLFLGAISGLKRLFYYESALLYDTKLDHSYGIIENIFSSAQGLALDVCINPSLQTTLREQRVYATWDLGDSQRFDRIFSSQFSSAEYAASLYPVSADGEVLMKNAEGEFGPSGIMAGDYDIEYGFQWQFRPNDKDVIRVTKKMYDSGDISQLLGIVVVDVSVLNISDPFWTFTAQTNINSRLYLLDERNELLFPYSLGRDTLSGAQLARLQSASYDLRNQQIIVVRSFMANHWKLVGTLNGSSLLEGSADLIKNIFLIGAMLILVGISITVFTANRLTNPIVRLADWIKQSSESRSYREISRDPKLVREVATLYDTFNDLMVVIRASMLEIKQAGERDVENEFLLLQAQINPHFLYNTLDSIGWIAMKHGATEVRDMVVYLVGMFRNGLNNGRPLIRVDSEVELVRCYINIMNMRYPDTYDASFSMEEDTGSYQIIKQLLQPLVENAIQHGFYGWGGRGRIEVSIFKDGGYLCLRVVNNGIPADLEKIRRLLTGDHALQSKHYGIRNVDERLRKLYGDENGLHFEVDGERTIASIRLPLDKLERENGGSICEE